MEKKSLSGYSLRIHEIREALGLKIAEFARKLDIPRSTLVGWEEGKTVSIEVLKPLEKIFNVNMDWLLTGKGEMFLPNHSKYGFTPRIRQIRERLGQDPASFAKEMGISRTALLDYEDGGSIPDTFAKKLQERFDVNYEWFIHGKGKMLIHDTEDTPENQKLENVSEGYKIPLLNQKVSCGNGADWEHEQNIEGYIDIFSLIPQHKLGRLFALSVQGNSMIGAGIKNGDYVLFCTGNDLILDDDIYVFSLDGEVFCKQLEFDTISKNIKIYSIRVADLEKAELLTTLNIEDTDFADRFHIFGRVFSWVHPNFKDE